MTIPLIPINQAIDIIQNEGVIAYPTEAVYGLGCNPFAVNPVMKIRTLKDRQDGGGFILIASNWQQVSDWVQPLSEEKLSAILATWPGHVTWIFPASSFAPKHCLAPDNTVAIRVTTHPVVIELCNALQYPLVSTSANTHGEPPARTAEQVWEYFPNQIDGIVAGELAGQAQPSQIWEAMTGKQIR